MNTVSVSAPGKLMLFGEHAVVYGRPCIVTAVGQRMRMTVEKTHSEELCLVAPEVDLDSCKKAVSEIGSGDIPRGARFVEIAIKNFFAKYSVSSGLTVTTEPEFKSAFGFGSSSASTVCVIKALSALFDLNLTEKELFDLSYQTALDVQGKGSGFDVAAAIYGGTLYFRTGGKEIRPLKMDSLPLVVGYSGVKADTVEIVDMVATRAKEDPVKVENLYSQMEEIVESARISFEHKDLEKIGELMNENEKLLASLGVETDRLRDMNTAAVSAGAYGAKLSGAGGGDCMIALVSDEARLGVESALEKVGGQVLSAKPNAEGVIIHE